MVPGCCPITGYFGADLRNGEVEPSLALLWQIYSRRCLPQIHFRQCGHRCRSAPTRRAGTSGAVPSSSSCRSNVLPTMVGPSKSRPPMSHRKTDLGIPRPRRTAKVVLGRVLVNRDCSANRWPPKRRNMLSLPDAQAIFCRRRHQPRRPPLANISPGGPAPTIGPGAWTTTFEYSKAGCPVFRNTTELKEPVPRVENKT
jgi:hypothetical protein